MSKIVYVGDPTINPKTGKPNGPCAAGVTSIRVGNEEVTFVAGEPVEVSPAIAERLKKSNHFKLVEEKAVATVPAKDPPKDPPKDLPKDPPNDQGKGGK